jgi:uncharacterized protein
MAEPMTEPTAAEPSMEEILASIRKIITEDDGPAPTVAAEPAEAPAAPPEPDVLVLTERAPPLTTDAPVQAPHQTEGDAWVGDAASRQATSSFEKLSTAIETTAPPSPAMPEPGRSLEDVTRELLRPLLKAWLDENLPRIVQARVDEEVARIARVRVR